MNVRTLALALSITVASAFSALAHDVAKGPHGGQVVDDAGHHVELTTKGSDVVLYLTDGTDKPISSAKATGRIITQAGSKQGAVELVAIEPNLMTARRPGPVAHGTKLVVSIRLSDGHDVKARFVAQ